MRLNLRVTPFFNCLILDIGFFIGDVYEKSEILTE